MKGPSETAPEQLLTLVASAPASSSEATGDVSAWKEERTQAVTRVHEKGASWFVFVLPFQCTDKATFTARIGKSEKVVTKVLGCAE